MIAGIDKSELVLFKFSKEETTTKLNWKHAKEFEFNQQMYDVVEKQVSKDSIHYWCWWDFKFYCLLYLQVAQIHLLKRGLIVPCSLGAT